MSDAIPVFGYGIGIGPAGGDGGLRQTSGKANGDLLSAALHEISRPLANTLFAMFVRRYCETGCRAETRIAACLHDKGVAGEKSFPSSKCGIPQQNRSNRRTNFPDAFSGMPELAATFAP